MKRMMIPLLLLVTGQTMAQQPAQAARADSSKILFLTFTMEKTGAGPGDLRCTLKNRLLASGTLNTAADNELPMAAHVLYYQLTEADGTQGPLIKLPDPLQMDYEFPTEGNRLGRTTINSSKGECTIRLQWLPRYKSISLYQPANAAGTSAISSPSKLIYHATL